MFFVCPNRVLDKILNRVGSLAESPMQTGSITILGYQIDTDSNKRHAPLVLKRSITTLTERLAMAFSTPESLPESGVYEREIRKAIEKRLDSRS
ncbi:MAG: hypothetical protein CMO80_08320 [Verrucomicrobiales bacterium]|nr:hypothetical protein [Verrucomicrobiales bacterium]